MAARRQQAAERPLRVYIDTSVFGDVHDARFRVPSERFFGAVRAGAFVVLVSAALIVEIASAPAIVQAVFEAHRAHVEALETTPEATALAEAYLAARVVPAASRVDALHVALASVAGGRRRRELELQAPGSAAPHPRLPRRERAPRLSSDRDSLARGGDR